MIDKLIKRFIEIGESSIAVRDWETYGGTPESSLFKGL